MRHAARSLTVLLGFLAMQLSLLGSAAACLASRGTPTGEPGSDNAAMASMPATARDAGDQHCNTPVRDSRTPVPNEQHCALMIACATSLDAPTGIALSVAAARVPSRVGGISERTPASFIVAPELPPPRV